jgi:hypothetical protein
VAINDLTVTRVYYMYECMYVQVILQWTLQQNVAVLARSGNRTHLLENLRAVSKLSTLGGSGTSTAGGNGNGAGNGNSGRSSATTKSTASSFSASFNGGIGGLNVEEMQLLSSISSLIATPFAVVKQQQQQSAT